MCQPLRVVATVIASALIAGCPQSGTRSGGVAATASDLSVCPNPTELSLPPGFCATVFADRLGPARHMVVRDNGDLYVALRGDRGGIVALRDTDGDGVADQRARFGKKGGTGIAIHDGYLYFATPMAIVRYRFDEDDALKPGDEPELVVGGFESQRAHASKTVEFDGRGGLLTNIGAPSNACQRPQRSVGRPGQDPCPELTRHAGIWRFDADRIGQDAYSDGERYAGGIRNAIANAWHPRFDRLYAVQHGRDQLSELWPDKFTQAQRVELPAEEFLEVRQGDEFGWPYCFFDPFAQATVLAPEYGGDGRIVGRCAAYKKPLLGFPAHWAPNDLVFYVGRHFPSRYRDGAFVAFHGSWNRAPAPQRGYNVVFVPMRDGELAAAGAGAYEIFADGFAQTDTIRGPADARYRPTGLAVSPDGRLYISDSRKGRIWRIEYVTPAESGL